MAFLPLDLDPEAVAAAQGSTDWRFEMWWSYAARSAGSFMEREGICDFEG